MSGLRDLQKALPTWVRLERPPETPEVATKQIGDLSVTVVTAFPSAPPGSVRADVHFVAVAPTEGLPEKEDLIEAVRAALGEGEFASMSAEDLAGGPSYITLGGWLGSQDLALMLIGAVELVGISKAITPKVFGAHGEQADMLAGSGLVMLGPSQCWTEGTR